MASAPVPRKMSAAFTVSPTYVEAITNPSHSEHDDYLEWYGPFDPAEFDAAKATRRMRKGLPTW
jgi:hypothetical protein